MFLEFPFLGPFGLADVFFCLFLNSPGVFGIPFLGTLGLADYVFLFFGGIHELFLEFPFWDLLGWPIMFCVFWRMNKVFLEFPFWDPLGWPIMFFVFGNSLVLFGITFLTLSKTFKTGGGDSSPEPFFVFWGCLGFLICLFCVWVWVLLFRFSMSICVFVFGCLLVLCFL